MVKILHAADFHLDSPFESLPEEKAALRRAEQRTLLDKLISRVEAEKVQIVLLSGDLFDSDRPYYETTALLERAFSGLSAQVFIAPGNHDYYCAKSPYASIPLPENVHIFTSTMIQRVELPEMNCCVWGAGFTSDVCPPILTDFRAEPGPVHIMVLHGDTENRDSRYNPISKKEIAASGLSYLALGHIHRFSGIKKAGKTFYAYPGCLEGRGFDEMGERGYILGQVDNNGCELRFCPMPGRRYEKIEIDVSDKDLEKICAGLPVGDGSDICRLILKGEPSGNIDVQQILEAAGDRFFHLTVCDNTSPKRDIWAHMKEDSLRGLFLRRIQGRYEKADEIEREKLDLALRIAMAAMDNREVWQR